MNFVKKWINCITSFVAGVLGLALSACNGMSVLAQVVAPNDALAPYGMSQEKNVKAFELITDSSLYAEAKASGTGTEFVIMKVFAIILMVVSILLIINSVVLLLKNLNVIKCNSRIFDIVSISLISAFLLTIVAVLISANVYGTKTEDVTLAGLKGTYSVLIPEYATLFTYSVVATLGIYHWLMLAIGIIATGLCVTFTALKRKSA